MRESGRGGGLGRFGDRQQRGAGPGERLDPGLPVDRVDQEGGVEAEGRPGPRSRPVPPGGHPACGGGDRAAGQQPVPVGDVVADLGRGEDERDGRGEPCPFPLGDGRGAHGAQRAGTGGAPALGRAARLSLRQDGDDQSVIVRDDTGELSVIRPQGQAQTAEMGHPLDPETFGEPMGTGPDDSEHDDPPGAVQPVRDARAPKRRASYRVTRSPVRPPDHPYGRSIIFSFYKPPYAGGTLTNRHIFCTSNVTNRLRADYPLGAVSASWTTIGIRKRCGTPRNRGERRRPWDRCARRVPGWAS